MFVTIWCKAGSEGYKSDWDIFPAHRTQDFESYFSMYTDDLGAAHTKKIKSSNSQYE